MTEQAKPQPSGFYATAKYMTEQELQSILGPHLTILRLANICGFEWGRESFFGRMQATLKQQSRIVFDMHPDSIRDFLPVEDCANMIAAIARQPVPGIFNAGSGFGTSCCKVAEWLMEGYGSGKLEVENDNRNDQFWLDMSKTATTFNAPAIAPEALRQRCLSYGERLRQNVAV
jgi:nucleoside-diphosphate-sugar epimerase